MTPSELKMMCDDIDKKLKHFLGDLLSDPDYQAFVDHLDGCSKCASRVRMMGSFTNQLWELGDIEVPSDLDSTILFQFNQAKKEPRKSKPKKPRKLVIGVVILIIGLIAFFGWKKFFKPEELNVEQVSDDAVIVQATAIKKKVSAPDPEAERLYRQLKDMAESLAPMVPKTIEKKVSEKKPSQEKEVVPVVKEPVASPSSYDAYSLHWHIPYFTESDIKQLVSTITMLNIDLDYDDPNFVIFKTINKRIKTIKAGVQFTHKIQLDLPDFIMDGSDPNGDVVVSISFTGQEPTYSTSVARGGALSSFEQATSEAGNSLDWHILLVSAQQDALLDIIQGNRGRIEYASKEVVVFSMPGGRINDLAKEIQSAGGIFADFGNTDFDTVSLLGMVNVLVYFSEQ